MRTPTVLAFAALAAAGLSAAAPSALAKDPPFILDATCEKKECALGDVIPIVVTLRGKVSKAATVTALQLGAPHSVMFQVSVNGGRKVQVAPLLGRYEPAPGGNAQGVFKANPLDREVVKPNDKPLQRTIEIYAIQTGEWTIQTVYGGIEKSLWDGILETKQPLKITVKPGPKGETRVGARIETTEGAMTAELLPDVAWFTVHNFWSLAKRGFYKDIPVHRIVAGFMIQTGDPKGDGSGGPGWCIAAEFNDLKHEKGVLSMARMGHHVNTAGSQFFVMHARNTGLDRNYTGFGRLVEGVDVLDAIAATPVRPGPGGERSMPLVAPKLKGVEALLLPPAAATPPTGK
jgi:peptidyl-prolyl cis-trans isomerase B (cyclophilin B)